ncbi:hypothetical protein SAMN05216490_3251 [Mucilaginibacter mallensis]|uniref:DUF5655 domain-containing protein n=1 Tax=Mucilaginibacter mallensis TaxID=652787 RepID=A0A1H1ZUH2_MUCMA|nr:DUF5655 domain-containing protein [Mucilaginibacter mallensis]SDT37227.1 hypothetical protein SAMN05216490_3251 [Mucilaginibacter mallensis]
MNIIDNNDLSAFLSGKSEQTLMLFNHFVSEYQKIAPVTLHPAKTMIGLANEHRRIAWATQLGKNFVHIVFPFKQEYPDNLCFQKIAQVPGDTHQFNHHFRMYNVDDVNEEVLGFMRLAYEDENI